MPTLLKIAIALRAIAASFVAGEYLAAISAAIDLLSSLGFTKQAAAMKTTVAGVENAAAREIAAGAAHTALNVLNIQYGLAAARGTAKGTAKAQPIEDQLEGCAVACDQAGGKTKGAVAPITGSDPAAVEREFTNFQANHGKK